MTLIAQGVDDLGNMPDASDAIGTAMGTAAFGAFAGFFVFLWVVGLISFGIWLWALIDVIRRNFTNPSDKNLWMILVIVGAFVGGPIIPIIYLIVGRKKGTIPGSAPAAK